MTDKFQLGALVGLALICAAPAGASPAPRLPLALAMEAVQETIRTCEARGFHVAVAVVNHDGIIQLQARGDASPIHSQRFAFRKAYTVMSMGPMFGVETSGDLAERIAATNPVGLAAISGGTTDLLFLPGGVLVRTGDDPIAAIGVSGAIRSSEDQECAIAGLSAIEDRL